MNEQELTEKIAIAIFGDVLKISAEMFMRGEINNHPGAADAASEAYAYASAMAKKIIEKRENSN